MNLGIFWFVQSIQTTRLWNRQNTKSSENIFGAETTTK